MPDVGANHIVLPVSEAGSPLSKHYRVAAGIRAFEQTLLDLFSAGNLSGTTHTCLGQEVAQVAVSAALQRERDCIFSNHRGHGHFLSYCGEAQLLFAEILGLPEGLCRGRGGSQHLQYRNFYSNGIQGGTVGNATGIALAEKLRESGAISVVWVGDGTFGEGLVYESMNMASLWSLPIVFVAELNGMAQTTPTSVHMSGTIAGRCAGFGIEATEVPGDDIKAAIQTARTVFEATRADSRPRCLISRAVRLGPHSKGDDTRDKDEMAAAWAADPLAKLRSCLDSADADTIDAEIAATIDSLKSLALDAT